MSGKRVYLGVIAALLVVIAVLAWKFVVAGSTRPGDDGRTVVVLAPGERALMLNEMRGFVAGLAQIADALSRDDMAAVATASRALGAERAHDVPAAMLGKLPLEFKQLAFRVHGGFDTIAHDAANGATPKQTLATVAGILQQCAACHERYQVGTPPPR
jgi:hypothetical protein